MVADFPDEETEGSIPDRFERMARRYPERVALEGRVRPLTYRELNAAANRVSRAILARRGTAPEPVALLFEQGTDAIVAMLGTLKAGKFYVPLDPVHPAARNAHILDETEAVLVAMHERTCERASQIRPGLDVLDINQLESGISSEDVGLRIAPDDLAYVAYTSGSTGGPKGVMQTHRNVLHKTRTHTRSAGICADDRVALLYSHASSGSVRDIFGALLNGAALCPFDVNTEGFGGLARWLAEQEISVYNSAATLFRHFANSLTGRESFPHLRLIHVGSETIYKSDAELFRKHFGSDCVFVARLGSTEFSPIREYSIRSDTRITGNTVPAGYAAEGADVLLLDETGAEVRVNEIGEIAVRSRYLFPGYWRRPDLTRLALVQDPQSPHLRIYKTGDLGRMGPDGCLEHLGRKDFQVKVRGYRVEVLEIETVLRSLDSVREAAVVATEATSGEPRLVAFIVAAPAVAVTAADLASRLREMLPEHMIPRAFAFVDSLPLTATGKIDRRALLALAPMDGGAASSVAPRNALEARLASIWQTVLNTPKVGMTDNVFALGATSLACLRVVSQIEKALGIRVPVSTLFQAPTIAELATLIGDAAAGRGLFAARAPDRGHQTSILLDSRRAERRVAPPVPGSGSAALRHRPSR